MNNSDNIYYEYLSLLKKFQYYKIEYILHKKFPFLFENNNKEFIKKETYLKAQLNYEHFETVHKAILDRFYLLRIKKRTSSFEFQLIMLLFFNIEDLKFNALIKKIKDPDKMPLSEDDYYEINLNEALELLILDEKEKFIVRKEFLLYSYLLEHKIISFTFSENISDNPLIFNENLGLSMQIINKFMNINSKQRENRHTLPYYNRLKIGDEGF